MAKLLAVCALFLVLFSALVAGQRKNELDSAAIPSDGSEDSTCTSPNKHAVDNWVDMNKTCTDAVRKQIQMEVDASYVYLSMAAHFSRDDINLPGFAHLFFEHASEEREHAMGLIEYLLMRGPADKNYSFTKDLITVQFPAKPQFANALDALKAALAKEKEVTTSIKNVIKVCEENGSDYHISDHLTGVYLEEQYRGMRELAGKISTLGKMMDKSAALGQFLFDKQLL